MVNMRKGDAPVNMTKTPMITIEVSWDSGTDYDAGAVLLMNDGTVVHLANFPARGVTSHTSYAGVSVSADAGVSAGQAGQASETITITNLDPAVVALLPWAYSAQGNGTGSFARYKVKVTVDNHAGEQVVIDAANANDDDHVYTCAPVLIRHEGGKLTLDAIEEYSGRSEENRPLLKRGFGGKIKVKMNDGPRNEFKHTA